MPIDTGDTAWILASTALVMLMTPGVGLFYGGLVRKKNFISMVAMSFVAFALVSVQWIVIGYSIAFGGDISGLSGNFGSVMLEGVGINPGPYSASIPGLLFMVYQMMFAAVTMAIVTSGMAERVKLSSFILFALLWTTLVYDPVTHWVWGGGWLQSLGFLDFAGGSVVHITAGFSALAIAFVIGKRSGFGTYAMEPHNIPMTLLGAGLLWFGWFGFNGGSALAANGLAVNALVVTNTAAAVGALAWLFGSWVQGHPSSLGMVSGAIAGLGAITPCAGYVGIPASIVIGAIAGILCYQTMLWRIRKNMDESLDAWSVHGIGGLWGTIAVGIFASAAINSYTGLLYGNVYQFIIQIVGAIAVMIYAFVISWVLAKIVDRLMGLRVSEEEEYVGLDLSQHGERA